MNIVISLLNFRQISHSDVENINKLLVELSQNAKQVEMEDVVSIARDNHLFIATDGGSIVGIATLITFQKLTGLVGDVEDVVVSNVYRGAGIGKKLMNILIETARAKNLQSLQLTSNSRRVAAHGLYHSLGFVIKDTTCFRLQL